MFKIHFDLCRKEETRVLKYTGRKSCAHIQERGSSLKKTINKSTSFPRPSTGYFEIGGNEKRNA